MRVSLGSSSRPVKVSISDARQAAIVAFRNVGVPEEISESVVEVLVDAEARGHPSHGLSLVELYAQRVLEGGIDPQAKPSILESATGVTQVHANGTFGQISAHLAARLAVDGARRTGVHSVAVRENNHIGMLAAYRHAYCAANVIGLILNVSGPSVSPPGGRKPTIGNNALCLVVPQSNGAPLICDMATGQVACGKIRARALRGESIPVGWLQDRFGRMTCDPDALEQEGSVPVFGGYKGLVVQVIVEVLAGILAGGIVSPEVNRQRQDLGAVQRCSQLFLGFDPKAFGEPNLEQLIVTLRSAVFASYSNTPPIEPFFPEQAEQLSYEVAIRDGIVLDERTARYLGLWASEHTEINA